MTRSDITSQLGMLIGRARTTSLTPEPPAPPSSLDVLEWNEDQARAICEILAWADDSGASRFFALTGPAGAGKTTVLRALRGRLGSKVAWAAMTGKAAARMREAAGVRARTLHSALYNPPREVDVPEEARIDLDFHSVKACGDSVLVVDESPMISPKIFSDLERSSYRKILLVGDPFQIPPVLSRREESEHGGDYSVFARVSGPHLGRVMRAQGAVLSAATYVRERLAVPTDSLSGGGSAYGYVSARSDDGALHAALLRYFEDPVDHVLVTWRNDARMQANAIVRKRLGYSGILPEPGEIVVIRKNVHDAGVMNGDDAVVEAWGDKGPTLAGIETRYADLRAVEGGQRMQLLIPTASFDGQVPYVGLEALRRARAEAGVRDDVVPITYGYCRTGHLVQGSEYRRSTVFLTGDMRSDYFQKMTTLPDGSRVPFSMRFLYVAISRAKETSTLVVAP